MKIFSLLFILTTFVQSNSGCADKNQNQMDAPPYNFNSYKQTPIAKLAEAVKNEDTALIRKLVINDGININYQEPRYGLPILAVASVHTKTFCVKLLLQLGADPNLKSPADENNGTPFLYFCNYGFDNETLRVFLKFGADVNSKETSKTYIPEYNIINVYKKTALELLCKSSTVENVRTLIENGASLDIYPKNGVESIVVTAIGNINKDIEILKYLLIEKKVPIPDYAVIRQEGMPSEEKISLRQLILEARYDLAKKQNTISVQNEILNYLTVNGK